MRSALVIFVRNPVLGHVKTRIAKDIGDEATLKVYQKLLEHTHSVTCNLDLDVFVFYADYVNDNDLWAQPRFQKRLQTGSDLGERMKNAFKVLFGDEGYNKICIIGSDCFDLTTSIIEEAFASLDSNNVVIGPSEDGGYYLLGMSYLIPNIFDNKRWSSDQVYIDTIADVHNADCTLHLLPVLSDVDTIADCKKYDALFTLTQ